MPVDHIASRGGPGDGEHLLANLLHFARLLRRLGFQVSASQLSDLAEALTTVNVGQRSDFYYTTRAFLVHHPDERETFDRAFDLFWSGRLNHSHLQLGSRVLRAASVSQSQLPVSSQPPLRAGARQADEPAPDVPEARPDLDVPATYSPWEILRHKDFAAFTDEELGLAVQVIEDIKWQVGHRRTRRQMRVVKRTARLHLPDTMRRSLHLQGEIVQLAWTRPKTKPRPLVVICDISGSMERYSRVLLRLMHALQHTGQPVEAFVFGTRLTRITPALRQKDVDSAVREVAQVVLDWSGGTRIGESLKTFNYRWGRRVLRRGALALIISDGWDRGDLALLKREIARLRRSVHRLLWLNPLLGTPDYQPLAQGMQTVLPYVDDFLPAHNLASLGRIASQLASM